jgi:hypothetical protein
MDKINNAKPDALLFADGQGIFNRQFSSLVLMTNYLIGQADRAFGTDSCLRFLFVILLS